MTNLNRKTHSYYKLGIILINYSIFIYYFVLFNKLVYTFGNSVELLINISFMFKQ